MVSENETLQAFVDKTAGWTDDQQRERDELIKKIESERNALDHNRNELFHVGEKINITESKMRDADRWREQTLAQLRGVEDRIEASNDVKLAKQTKVKEIENVIEALNLQLQECREELSSNDESAQMEKTETKQIEQQTKEAQLDVDKSCREFKDSERKIVAVSKELERQHQKNIELEKDNAEKMKMVKQKVHEAKELAEETGITETKKELVSEKIVAVEKDRVKYETERDELKLRLNKIGSVELKMMGKELDAQKRQIEGLQREMAMLERKEDMTEMSSSTVKDIIASNENTLRNLQNELSGLCHVAKQYQDQIVDLHASVAKEHQATEVTAQRRRETMAKLAEEEQRIEDLHKKLENAETIRKQKQNKCDSIKTESNLQSKKLAENHEELERAKRELDVINRQMKTLKVNISHTENDVVMEHYSHHHTDDETDTLKLELEELRQQINDVNLGMERNKDETSRLGHAISDKDKDCEKYAKEHSVLVSNRDIIGSLLVQKNSDLEKIQEKIKSQQSILHHSEVQYLELMSSIMEYVLKLKDLVAKKEKSAELGKVNDELMLEAHSLENDIHRERLKTTALREELGRPVNIHRWRSLEHCDPQKFEKIQRIQRLQKQIIATAESIAEKDILMSGSERAYLEVKRISDHQPQLSEVHEQLELYQSNLSEKLEQMKQIEFEIDVQKRRVNDLSQSIEDIEHEEKQLQSEWIRQASIEDDEIDGT